MTTSTPLSTVLIINGRNIVDLANDKSVVLARPNTLTEQIKGANGNVVIIGNAEGEKSELTIRVLQGTDDDTFLMRLAEDTRKRVDNFVYEGQLIQNFNVDGEVKRTTTNLLSMTVKNAPTREFDSNPTADQVVSVYVFEVGVTETINDQ